MPSVEFWHKQLVLADKKEEKWRKKADEIYRLYRDERDDSSLDEFRFNILWANTETQRPALLSSTPKPHITRRITRRFDEQAGEQISRFGAELIERALEFTLDPGNGNNFESFGQKCVSDFLLPGRAVARIDYVPTIANTKRRVELEEEEGRTGEQEGKPVERDDKGFFMLEDEEEVIWEEVTFSRVSHALFRQDPAADEWDDVEWVAFGTLMSRTAIDNQPEFTVDAEDVPLNFMSNGERIEENDRKNKGSLALVWQIWSREDRKVYYVVDGFPELLTGKNPVDDPLNLQGFYPCPEPAYILPDPETLIPTPEFRLYQDQAREIDRITARIAALITMLKAVGIYAGEDKDIVARLRDAVDGDLVPINDYLGILEKGGLSGIIDWLPIDDIIKTVQVLIAERADLIRQVFELTGISDIQRGATDPRETRGAQVIKANFATRRLLIKQQTIQRFFRDLYRLAGELIVEKFSPGMVSAMTAIGEDVLEQTLPVMRNDALRSFRVDIETDSTVAPDEQKEKEGVAEFVSALSRITTAMTPILQSNPQSAPFLGQIVLWAMRRFKVSREIEDQLQQAISSAQQQQGQQQQDPEAQAKAQEAQVKMQTMIQEAQQKLQLKQEQFKLEVREALSEIQRKDAEVNAKIAKIAADIENKKAESRARVVRSRQN